MGSGTVAKWIQENMDRDASSSGRIAGAGSSGEDGGAAAVAVTEEGSLDKVHNKRPGFMKNDAKKKKFPTHWGNPPRVQTRDLRPLPGGYGMGSGTVAKWIQENMDRDVAAGR
jgi:hypothetical protein